MLTLAEDQAFLGFGRSALIAPRPARLQSVRLTGQTRLACRRLVREQCPNLPGVYGWVDADGHLIYVGKAKSLRDRLLSYFLPDDPDSKGRQIAKRSQLLVWEPAPHEFTALVRELELIRRFQPRFNVQGQPRRMREVYVCLERDPAPYFYLASTPGARAKAVFGPIRGRGRADQAVRRLNDQFALRDCPERLPMVFADQLELFDRQRSAQCLRHEIGTCLAPCAAFCSASQYAAQVRSALALVDGGDRGLLDDMEAEIGRAAAALEFERAAALRDIYADLAWLDGQLGRLRQARRHFSFVYRTPRPRGREVWHWIVRGQIAAITPGPHTPRNTRRCHRLAERLRTEAACAEAGEDAGMLLLVTSWFRKFPAERRQTLPLAKLHKLLG